MKIQHFSMNLKQHILMKPKLLKNLIENFKRIQDLFFLKVIKKLQKKLLHLIRIIAKKIQV